MNDLQKIKCSLVRGGTSKGAFFLKENLPKEVSDDKTKLFELMLKVIGSPDPKQIDGIGGGTFVTSKVAIVSPSDREDIDVDYKFLQVMVSEAVVDDKPTCGNILSGVGVFALENGLVPIGDPTTKVTIYDINTGATIIQHIPTPNKIITYKGDFSIAGVLNTSAPIDINFFNIAGGKTGSYLPTGNVIDNFDGIESTCLDVSMPVVFLRAEDVGVTGYEDAPTLDGNTKLFETLFSIREQASIAMGLGSAKDSVIPKIAIIGTPKQGGDINIRYFTPANCHTAIALSAGFCLSTGCFIPGTLMHQIYPQTLKTGSFTVNIENPSGITPISVHFPHNDITSVEGATSRTARILFDGFVYI